MQKHIQPYRQMLAKMNVLPTPCSNFHPRLRKTG
jgi:hypothetical protein